MIEFLGILKVLKEKVDLDPSLKDRIKNMTVNFSFMHLMYQHFSKLCNMVTFTSNSQPDQTQKHDYSKTLKSIAWLIFVLLRKLWLTKEGWATTLTSYLSQSISWCTVWPSSSEIALKNSMYTFL